MSVMCVLGDICHGWSRKVNGFSTEVNEFGKGMCLYVCHCVYGEREGDNESMFNLLSCAKVAGIMDQFERQFEHLDVQTQSMEEAMSGVTTLTTPEVCRQINGVWCFLSISYIGPSHRPHAASVR